MVESKDKGVPLMKPTFFEKNDPIIQNTKWGTPYLL